MKIIINATAHNNQESMREYYTEQLQKKFSKYQFINSLEVWVKKIDDKEYEVSMLANPKKGAKLFAEGESHNEQLAFTQVMKKLRSQLNKYKTAQNSYHSTELIQCHQLIKSCQKWIF